MPIAGGDCRYGKQQVSGCGWNTHSLRCDKFSPKIRDKTIRMKMKTMPNLGILFLLPLAAGVCHGQNTNVYSPAVLPGNGLAQHDFVYSGEAHKEQIFIVRGGRIVWSYTHPARGEISQAVLEPNGHILFAHQFGITEITLDKKVVWNFDAPRGTEIHTATPIGTNSVMFIENAQPAKLIVMNKNTGAIEHEFELPVNSAVSVHRQFRRAEVTAAGTVLVAFLDLGRIAEYDWNGRALWSQPMTNCFSATELPNGDILAATSGEQFVREINRQGHTVWEWTAADAPDYKFHFTQVASRLPNGDTLINNWYDGSLKGINPDHLPVQAIEVTPDKKIVWALRSWTPPAALGPSTTIQILDGTPLDTLVQASTE